MPELRPVALPANQPRHFYRGGAGIGRFRGAPPPDEYRPEDWVGSATSRFGGDAGLTVLPDGRSLRTAIAEDPAGWLGPEHVRAWGESPALLVKLLDAGQRLPVHVHPTREFMTAQTGGVHGKTEAWIVLSAEPGSTLGVGFSRDVSLEELADWVERQDVEALTAATLRVPVAAGDVVFCPASVPHSIGDGILLVEVEEPTDLSIMLEWKGYQVDGPRNGHIGLGFDRALTAVDRSAWTPERVEELAVRRGAATVIAPVAKRALVTAPPVVKDLPVTALSETGPVKTVIVRAARARPATSPAVASRGASQASASPLSPNRASVASVLVSQARAKAPVVPLAASRAAKARVANLLEAGE